MSQLGEGEVLNSVGRADQGEEDYVAHSDPIGNAEAESVELAQLLHVHWLLNMQ